MALNNNARPSVSSLLRQALEHVHRRRGGGDTGGALILAVRLNRLPPDVQHRRVHQRPTPACPPPRHRLHASQSFQHQSDGAERTRTSGASLEVTPLARSGDDRNAWSHGEEGRRLRDLRQEVQLEGLGVNE